MSPMNPMFTAPGGRQPQMLGRVSPPAPPPTNMNTIYGPDPKAPPIMAYGPGGQAPMPQTQPPMPQTQPPAPQAPVGGAPQGGGMSPGRTALIRSVMARAGGPARGGMGSYKPPAGRPMAPPAKPAPRTTPMFKPPGG